MAITINKNNYEAFFLDYYERNLSAEQVAELLLFVEQHPELKELFEGFESIAIDCFETSEFKNKTSLKKVVLSTNEGSEASLSELDYLLISSVEKTSTLSENKKLKELLESNSDYKKELHLYAQTLLKPNTDIVFKGKQQLKKKNTTLIPFYYSIAIAASIALVIGIFYFNKSTSPKENIIVETSKNLTNKKKQVIKTENKTEILETKKTNTSIHKNNIASNSTIIKINNNNSTLQKEVLFFTVPDTTIISAQTDKQPILDTTLPVIDTSNTLTKMYAEVKNNIVTTESQENNNHYLSIKELATQKLKETLLENEKEIQENKKTATKLNGWDIAQLATKGISKIAGKKIVELTPNYNNNGDVISYAFKAGKFEVLKEL